MRKLRVVPLVCPDCGRGLVGLRYDKLFFCMTCTQGVFFKEEGCERYPLHFVAPGDVRVKVSLHLPMWELGIRVEATPANDQQEEALKRLDQLKSVWVTGFTVVRPSYYGDLGLIYTERGVEPETSERMPPGAYIAGCTRTIEDASRYAGLFVTLILDKKADVTGMDLSIETEQAALWAIPFTDTGDKITDLIAGASMPVFAVDDLEDIRRISRNR